ncbi:MAG TPA: membrane protein insertase YidC [Chitinophagaceae bacterium]|nr:membrane protein insertase YidC [Chitinophagaceae bacterium]
MKFDRNTILGFVILAALFFGYFYYTNREQSAYRKQQAQELARKKAVEDSLARINRPREDSLLRIQDSLTRLRDAGGFRAAADTAERTFSVENELMRIHFSNRGGRVRGVELKKFKGLDSSWVRLASTDFDKLSYAINTAPGRTEQTANLFFPQVDSIRNADGSQNINFTLHGGDSGSVIRHSYTIRPANYMIDFSVSLSGADKLLTGGVLNLDWYYTASQQESDRSYEVTNTQVGYIQDGSFDYHTIGRRSSKVFREPVSWVGVRQRFFFTILVAKNQFSEGKIEWTVPSGDTNIIVQSVSNMKVQLPVAGSARADFNIYYGPSDYYTLKQYGMRFEKLVNLGQGFYAFVRPLNKFIILPIYDLMQKLAGNVGIAIALLTIIIRLLISPLTYKSYLSGAKMKALRPEIALLREKYGKDQQQMSMEQMKLFREAGVNPLGGCIPALLQIPIFFALFSFFSSEVGLRGAEFLWANDLAAFDDPIKFGFHIPLLGSHLSLFNLTATVTSFLISWYSMSMTPDQSNPVLKYMPYIFPVFLLFFFNRLPAALTWYYTVSNIITLVLQFVIQNYIIDHDKILAKIEENRKKPKPKSRWQERLEQMQEQQKKLKQQQQQRSRR